MRRLDFEEAWFITPLGVRWTRKVCWTFFLAMAMWRGKLRENVCDWRLRRRDWNSSGMNAAVQVFGQRMCKISFWCGKKKAQHKKNQWNEHANHSIPTCIQKTLGFKHLRLFEKLHGCWFHGTTTNRINRKRWWPFSGRWCLSNSWYLNPNNWSLVWVF